MLTPLEQCQKSSRLFASSLVVAREFSAGLIGRLRLAVVEMGDWQPGKYVAYTMQHVVNVQVFHDGEVRLHETCRSHKGRSVPLANLQARGWKFC